MNIYEKLQIWRNEDHEDNIILCRNEVVEILEQYKSLDKSRNSLVVGY